jgi:hypothetical protein
MPPPFLQRSCASRLRSERHGWRQSAAPEETLGLHVAGPEGVAELSVTRVVVNQS